MPSIVVGMFPPPARLLSTYRLLLWYINVSHILLRLFNIFWSVEKHDANPANTGTIGLVKSVLICG